MYFHIGFYPVRRNNSCVLTVFQVPQSPLIKSSYSDGTVFVSKTTKDVRPDPFRNVALTEFFSSYPFLTTLPLHDNSPNVTVDHGNSFFPLILIFTLHTVQD
jgi:hypothetical protein